VVTSLCNIFGSKKGMKDRAVTLKRDLSGQESSPVPVVAQGGKELTANAEKRPDRSASIRPLW
jgi:hypothetical protein